MDAGRLYFGDCLEVMREDMADETVDLIYLDPPFNSKRLYNAYIGGAQWVAFDDTWKWSEAEQDFHEIAGKVDMADTMEGLRRLLSEGPQLAYLSYMANRLRECFRVLKPTGSLYLHCDPTMSHYLKIVLDGLSRNLPPGGGVKNEIIWCYKLGGRPRRGWPKKHDVIFFCTKSKEFIFNSDLIRIPYDSTGGYISSGRKIVGGKEYRVNPLGKVPEDWWPIPAINRQSKERQGYPTQKPIELLQRIIKASSNKGDLIFDPFCGCGTTIEVAISERRKWIGIDICVNACKVIENRLTSTFEAGFYNVEFNGMPRTRDDALVLARREPFKFERWAASLVDGLEANKKQVGDGGIDGRGRFPVRKGVFIDVVSQVKGGSTQPRDIQAFNTARQQVGADIGIFTCFEDKVTQKMRDVAVNVGRFREVPCIQIFTVEDYFARRRPMLPLAA